MGIAVERSLFHEIILGFRAQSIVAET